MAGWFILYLGIIVGLCYMATESELEGAFACGVVLFIIGFVSVWTIGRILVNPENRLWAIVMLGVDVLAMIYVVIHMVKNR